MSKHHNPISRRHALASIGAGVTGAAITGSAAAAIASQDDPIIALCAEALRIGAAANAATIALDRAETAAEAAGYPTDRPSPVRLPFTENEDDALVIRTIIDVCDPSPEKRAQEEARLREIQSKADADKADRLRRERAETEAALAKWEEGRARFGLDTAGDAFEQAHDAHADALLKAMDARPISLAGALALVALAHVTLAYGDDQAAGIMLDTARSYFTTAGMMPGAVAWPEPVYIERVPHV